MTLEQMREVIAESPKKDWLQSYKLEVYYPHVNYRQTIEGVYNIYQFVSSQAEGFNQYSSLPDELEKMKERFIQAKGSILTLFSQNNFNPTTWDSNLRFIKGEPNTPILLFNFPEVEFLLKISSERPEMYAGAYEYLIGSTSRAAIKTYLDGYLIAYEFASKGISVLAQRKDAEEKSIQNIRSEFQKNLGKAENEVIEYFARTNKKFQDYSDQIDILKTEKKVVFDSWFENASKQYAEFNAASLTKITELEELYKEKLKLEAPAKYWSDRARVLRKAGNGWLLALVLSVAFGIVLLSTVLMLISTGELENIFSKTAMAIKWSIVFVTLVSFIAFAIRIFSKLTFSSYHLVRDAEEREQLTYVYLALQKEKGIDQTERHLIMQSIFSRADSGLLKDDSGPTMPGQIMDQVSKR